jgi:hypothetical protein
MKIDVVIGSEECRFMLTAGTSEPRDAGNAAAGADGSGRGEGSRQSRGKKCAHCLKLQKDREPGQPTFKKCGQCRTTFYCGAQVRIFRFSLVMLLYFLLYRALAMCLGCFGRSGVTVLWSDLDRNRVPVVCFCQLLSFHTVHMSWACISVSFSNTVDRTRLIF